MSPQPVNQTLSLLDVQILATLAYSNQFQFPLTLKETRLKLISRNQALSLVKQLKLEAILKEKDETASPQNQDQKQVAAGRMSPIELKTNKSQEQDSVLDQIKQRLQQLTADGIVTYHQGHYCLTTVLSADEQDSGLALQQLVQARRHKQAMIKSLTPEMAVLRQFLSRLPLVAAAGISGSMAFGNVDEHTDIDLIIITHPSCLWLARLIALTLSWFKGKKRFRWQAGQDRWCFNLWLTTKSLTIPSDQRTIYSAYEASHINWLYDPYQLESNFYQQNQWLQKYLAYPFATIEAAMPQQDDVKHRLFQGLNKTLDLEEDLKKENDLLAQQLSYAAIRSEKRAELYQENWLCSIVNRLLFTIEQQRIHYSNQVPYKNLNLDSGFLHDGVSYQQYIKDYQQLFGRIWSKS